MGSQTMRGTPNVTAGAAAEIRKGCWRNPVMTSIRRRHHSPATTISGCWLPNIRRRLTGRSWEAVLRPAFLARLSSHLQKRLEICSWPLCCRVLCGWAPWANIGALRLVNCGQYHCTPCFKLRSIRCKFLMQVSFAYVTLLGSKWPLNFQ